MFRNLLIGIFTFILSACSTIPYVDIGAIADRTKYEKVQFPNHLEVDQFEQPLDSEDPRDLVSFAMNLADQGDHEKAAVFYEEAAKISSRNNRWAIACLTAAANEHLKAGNLTEFNVVMEKLIHLQSRLQRAASEPLTETLLSVHQLTKSGQVDVNQLPVYLRDIVKK